MVNLRHASNETIKLGIMGPKSIIPRTMYVETRLSNTWLQLLNNEIGLNVTLDEGIFVCTSRYTPTSPKHGEGWRAELTERISVYTNKFERRRKQYTARLCHPQDVNLSANGTSPSKRYRAPTPGPAVGITFTGVSPLNLRQRSMPVPRSVHQDATANRRPNIVIATRGSATSTSNGLASPPQRYRRDDNYLKPRYHTANGLPPRTPQGAQQVRYGTRLKRLYDQTVVGKPRDTLSTRRGTPLKSPMTSVAMIKQEYSQRVTRNADAAHSSSRRNFVPNNVDMDESISVGTIKMEMPSVVDESQFFDDESQSENGSEMNESSDEEQEESEDEHQQQSHSRTNGGGSRGGAGNNFIPMNSNNDFSEDDDDDGASQFTTATQEEMELTRSGIQVDDIKSLAERRFSEFSNAYMLRIRNEIKKLKGNKQWMRNVQRAPLSCVLLDQVFK